MQKYQVFIGIDISKHWIDVCPSYNGQKKDMSHQRFDNEEKGFKKMVGFIKAYEAKCNVKGRWLFCMEHTGIYVLPLCNFLEQRQLDYVLENGLQISKSLGIRREKSDKTDAADIARYLFLHRDEVKLYQLPACNLFKIKNLLSLYRRLKKAQVALKTAAKELDAFSAPALSQTVVQISRDTSSGLEKKIEQVKQAIMHLIKTSPELDRLYQLISSVKGVGLIIGATLLVYTNGFQGFQTARQFACYIGLAPFSYTSGTSVHKPDKVSNLANKKIKALISNGAMVAIRYDHQIRAYYFRKIKEGKNPLLVQNNVKNKLVQRIFAVVKRGTPYVELGKYSA